MTRYEQEQQQVTDAIASFPREFGLRAFPGKRFRIAPPMSCFVSDGEVQLVVQVHDPVHAQRIGRTDAWLDFGRNTPDHVRRELVMRDEPTPADAAPWPVDPVTLAAARDAQQQYVEPAADADRFAITFHIAARDGAVSPEDVDWLRRQLLSWAELVMLENNGGSKHVGLHATVTDVTVTHEPQQPEPAVVAPEQHTVLRGDGRAVRVTVPDDEPQPERVEPVRTDARGHALSRRHLVNKKGHALCGADSPRYTTSDRNETTCPRCLAREDNDSQIRVRRIVEDGVTSYVVALGFYVNRGTRRVWHTESSSRSTWHDTLDAAIAAATDPKLVARRDDLRKRRHNEPALVPYFVS